jgi:hypothetical protein
MVRVGQAMCAVFSFSMSQRRVSIRRIVIALLAGAFITVALAWLAMFLPWDGQKWYGPRTGRELGMAMEEAGQRTFQINDGRNRWHHVVSYWWMQISGQSWSMRAEDFEKHRFDFKTLPSHLRPARLDELVMSSRYHETGWPLPALTCAVHWERQLSNADVIYRVDGGLQLPRDGDFDPRALPLTPVWPGFAADVLLWAGACWMMMWLAGAMRRRYRRWRHRCLYCGYSHEGLPLRAVCPECGR